MDSNKNTEKEILEAAKKVFQNKGMAGARMQEIADNAGINKAMLHYYFRSKEKLFNAVFISAFSEIAEIINKVFSEEIDLFSKIKKFTDQYISFLEKNPYLPLFVISESNHNPDFFTEFVEKMNPPRPQILFKQIEAEIEKGTIHPIHPLQLVINLISLCIFPIIAKNMLINISGVSEKMYNQLIENRKKEAADFIINAIKK